MLGRKTRRLYCHIKKQRNRVKSLLRKDSRTRQSEISRDCRDNPKRFWNYVNSKTKYTNKIGDLIESKDDTTEVANTDALKAEALSNFFSSVFVQEPDTPFSTLPSQSAQYDNELLVISESDIISKLDKINKYKSPGPHCIYPRILYELRYNISYPLMLIFNCSLRNNVTRRLAMR